VIKLIFKGAGVLGAILFLFFAGLFIGMSLFDSPTYAWRILRNGESDINDVRIFPERIIENRATYSIIERGHGGTPYEVEYPYQGEMRREVLDELLKRTGTRAFLILKDDKLIHES
jgi:hypothetical protein